MKITADTLGNIMCRVLYNAMDGELTSTRYGEMDMSDFDQADAALAISRQLAVKKKRIVLDIKYDR